VVAELKREQKLGVGTDEIQCAGYGSFGVWLSDLGQPSAGKVTTEIEGRAFVYTDRESGRVTTILGYPTAKNAQLG
jgi:hypothetical protein